MEAQIHLREILVKRMDEIREQNARFSLRAFARLIAINPSALSEFLSGKRRFSPKMMRRIAEQLSLSPNELRELNDRIIREYKMKERKGPIDKEKVLLNSDQYYLVAEWHYYAILCLVETNNFQNNIHWIAGRLNLSEKKVEEAISRLTRLGILVEQGSTFLVKDIELVTTEDVPNFSLKKRHEENLEAARASLYGDDLTSRDFSFGTIAIDPTRLPAAKKMIREFQDKLFSFLESGQKSEVYEIAMHMFPRTKIELGE